MNDTYNKKLIPNAKTLRKNMTKEERHLWYDFLKELPIMVLNIMKMMDSILITKEMPI